MKFVWLGHLILVCTMGMAGTRPTANPCTSAVGWKEKICAFAKKSFVHPAWGYEHGIRDYLLSTELAREDSVTVDDEILFAAGLLHDMGGFPPYEAEGVDHALRSTQVVEAVLKEAGFPMAKADAVKKAILTHSYYEPTRPETPEAVVLHDADTLDFLGIVSATRLLATVGKEKVTPNIRGALKVLEQFQKTLPAKLYGGAYSQKMGLERATELKAFLNNLDSESYGFILP